jgi:regulator of nucleoside diphosphate kinase
MEDAMKNVLNRNCVLINERDFDRLYELVQSPRLRMTHAPMVLMLKQELNGGTVVSPYRVPENVVTMNARVQFRDLGTSERETYTLVYPEMADLELQRLSVLTPLGAALLGASVGDVVECKTPGGIRKLKVEKLLYQPEAAGDFHL